MQAELVQAVRKRREALGWTQAELAAALGSSRSRVCKMEAGDATVAVGLCLRALTCMGLTLRWHSDEACDPLACPTLNAEQRQQLARAMLYRQWAQQIAQRAAVDAGDVYHALRNLDLSPAARLSQMRQRARLYRLATDKQ
ncbi:MAG: helix-turn-helix domain-containing protein [Polyangiales bacterium]